MTEEAKAHAPLEVVEFSGRRYVHITPWYIPETTWQAFLQAAQEIGIEPTIDNFERRIHVKRRLLTIKP